MKAKVFLQFQAGHVLIPLHCKNKYQQKVVGCLGFMAYLTPNPILCKLSVLYQTIQFSMSTQLGQKHFYFKLLSLVKQF